MYTALGTSEGWKIRPSSDPFVSSLAPWLSSSSTKLAAVSEYDGRLSGILESLGVAEYFSTILPYSPGGFDDALKTALNGTPPASAAYLTSEPTPSLNKASDLGTHAMYLPHSPFDPPPSHLSSVKHTHLRDGLNGALDGWGVGGAAKMDRVVRTTRDVMEAGNDGMETWDYGTDAE